MRHRMPKGTLFVLSGPSGAGKGTLRRILFDRLGGLAFSVSCTTREPRPGERDGADYRFVDEETFRRLEEEGRFLESAEVHGHRYGTLRDDVERDLEAGRDVILEIDVQGAEQIKRKKPEAFLVFVLPPSMEALASRLAKRGTEAPEERALRLHNAEAEIGHASEFDRAILNDDANRAAAELIALVRERRKARREETE